MKLKSACLLALAVTSTHATADPPLPATVATIGGEPVSAQELDQRSGATIRAQQELYAQRALQLKLTFDRDRHSYLENQLSALLDEHALKLEATERHSSPEALLQALPVAPPDEAAVREFYEANKSKINLPYEAAQSKLREYLQAQAQDGARRTYVQSLRVKYHAESLLEPRRDAVEAIGPQRGPASAPVTLVEFSDFECPFCGHLEPVIRGVLEQYPDQVRLVYRHFPLPDLHPHAQKAAEAAVCAERQGKFWEMHDLLFAEQAALGVDALKEKARRLKLNTTKFDDCLQSAAAGARVREDRTAGESLGLYGTPGTFVNGRFLAGELTAKQLSDVIDDELHRRQLSATR
jgi:protein-disulfide isomerase